MRLERHEWTASWIEFLSYQAERRAKNEDGVTICLVGGTTETIRCKWKGMWTNRIEDAFNKFQFQNPAR